MAMVKIQPGALAGTVNVPSSKSMGHREIICAALARGESVIDNISMSEDIAATLRCLNALGVRSELTASKFKGRSAVRIYGTGTVKATGEVCDCGESGSTLRFLLPLGALCGAPVIFSGAGRLGERPLKPYYDIFNEQNVKYTPVQGLPVTVEGNLHSGTFKLPGNVSSQFVSGLLFALPLLDGDSEIIITTPLESQSYIDLTLSALAKYGIKVQNNNYQSFVVHGGQQYQSGNADVEGDWSQAAFWLAAGCLNGNITCAGADDKSLQGDRVVKDILQRMGGSIVQSDSGLLAVKSNLRATVIDAADCPDIIPVLTVAAAVAEGQTKIINAGRLRIKECDRLHAIAAELNKLGADVIEQEESLVINGRPQGLRGGRVSAWNDHRIAMSMAVASTVCTESVIIEGSESVKKSYPTFWQDFALLSGRLEQGENL